MINVKSVANLPIIEWNQANLIKDKRNSVLITSPSALKIAKPFLTGINFVETIFINNSHQTYADSLKLKNKTVQVAYLV
ncbi:MAG: hypothetical protein U0946_01215, partial [Patescibacteria group bacterium]|nr:hypothetical protein [Patescibacteria group bacterium]